ncbi:MAG: AAA family ATPase [Lachnospiraceae bacterium]|nr:AAA family ATPase [Lachnospiraceae bacterium]
MKIIGRTREQDQLERCLFSQKPEFIVVYGRRRVGKTFLIKEFFNNQFAFYATGLLNGKTHSQLKNFNESLISYGDKEKIVPRDWYEAFRRLRILLKDEKVYRDAVSGRKVVFLDEVPWMDTARSDFRTALDHFWNGFGSSEQELLLIVCGSATSWITSHILFDKGGFYNRITGKMLLNPFTLQECEAFFENSGIVLTRRQIIESYMVFGGIPYYLNLFDKRQGLVQNIDELVINPQGQLHFEYDHLFESLFKNAKNHIRIIEAIAEKKTGMLRTELAEESGVSDGEGLTKALRELEQCGFIRRYKNYAKNKQGYYYQLIDPFVLFSYRFLREEKVDSWQGFYKTGAYYSWRGNAFEIVCLCHIPQIKQALGISGVSSTEYSWRSASKKGGAQIDLLIDRRDDVINICEMKYTDTEFVIDQKYEEELRTRVELFRTEVRSDKALHITLVTEGGLKRNEYSDVVQNVVSGDDLFV